MKCLILLLIVFVLFGCRQDDYGDPKRSFNDKEIIIVDPMEPGTEPTGPFTDPTSVPEPATISLILFGLGGMALHRRILNKHGR